MQRRCVVCALAVCVGLGIPPLAQSVDPAAGPDTVVNLDADTLAVRDVVPVGQDPLSLAVAGGSVWTHNVEDGTLSRIDPARNSATVIKLGEIVGMASTGEDLWVAYRGNRLALLDGRTGRVERTLRIGSKRLFRKREAGFVAYAHGALWVTLPVLGKNQARQQLVRIDPMSGGIAAFFGFRPDVAAAYICIFDPPPSESDDDES
jgi:streptogramin lyase